MPPSAEPRTPDGVLDEGGATLDAVGPGSALGGRYTLGDRLDDAPDRSTWQAHDTTLDRRVRILVVAPEHPAAEDVLDAARRAAAVDDPRLVRVLDVGHDTAGTYVVTEWLDGQDLATLVAAGPLVAEEARALVGEACLALEVARRRGLHHLRLRPALVHRLEDGSVKVEGLVTEAALDQVEVTDGDEASRVDARGLVAVAYAALTGLWPDGDDPDLAEAPRLQGVTAPPSQLVAGVPADLDALCAQALAGHGGPATPGDLARQIAPWGNERRAPRTRGAFPHALPPVRLAPGTPGSPSTPLRAGSGGAAAAATTSVHTSPGVATTTPTTAPTTTPTTAPTTTPITAPTPTPTTAPTPVVPPAAQRAPRLKRGRGRSRADAGEGPPTELTEPIRPARPTSAPDRGARTTPPAAGPGTEPTVVLPVPPPSERTADHPAHRTAEHPTHRTAEHPTQRTAEHPTDRTAEHPTPPAGAAARPGPARQPAQRPAARPARPAPSPTPPDRAGRSLPADLLGIAQGGGRGTASAPAVARPPRRQSRTAIAVVVGFLVLIAILGWKGLSGLGADPFARTRSGTPSPTASVTGTPTTSPSSSPAVVQIQSASGFDPDGDQTENDDRAGQAVDGNPDTSWVSDTYRSAEFGGLKPGVGLRLDLGGRREVHRVKVQLGGSGATVQLRTPDGNNVSSTVLARKRDASGTVTLEPSSPVQADQLVLWFTRAAAGDGGFRVEVAEVSVS